MRASSSMNTVHYQIFKTDLPHGYTNIIPGVHIKLLTIKPLKRYTKKESEQTSRSRRYATRQAKNLRAARPQTPRLVGKEMRNKSSYWMLLSHTKNNLLH